MNTKWTMRLNAVREWLFVTAVVTAAIAAAIGWLVRR